MWEILEISSLNPSVFLHLHRMYRLLCLSRKLEKKNPNLKLCASFELQIKGMYIPVVSSKTWHFSKVLMLYILLPPLTVTLSACEVPGVASKRRVPPSTRHQTHWSQQEVNSDHSYSPGHVLQTIGFYFSDELQVQPKVNRGTLTS